MKIAYPLELLLFLGFIIGCSCLNSDRALKKHDEELELTLSPNDETRSFRLVISNSTSSILYLDKQLLTPIPLFHIQTTEGNEIERFSPPTPYPPDRSQMITLRGGKSVVVTINVNGITDADLSTPPYSIFCHYNTTDIEYPKDMPIWRGNATSNRIAFQ